MSKVMGIYVKFYHDHSPNMVLSRDPKQQNSKIFMFRLILYYISGKDTKFGGNWLKNKKVTGKNPVLIGLSFLHHT